MQRASLTTVTPPASDSREMEPAAVARPADPCTVLQGFLLLDLGCRLLIWSSSIVLAFVVFARFDLWPKSNLLEVDLAQAWEWMTRVGLWVVLYNLIYVAELVVLRLPIPTPQEGVYSTRRPPEIHKASGRQLLYSCFIALLTKARYEAPFPGFLVFHIANLPPMRWLMGPIFGPKSRSCYVTDPLILDPSLVEIGRNVVLGSGTNIAGHCQLPDLVSIRKTRIEDDVIIGANSTIFGGVTIRKGAMLGAGSVLPPFTTVGPCEYWAGVPAVKIRDLPRPGHLSEV